MTISTANALYRYFEALYSLNQNLMVLCGTNVFDHKGEQERRADEMVMSVPRLIPYVFNKKAESYEVSQTDGLMRFSQDLPFLEEDYKTIFQRNKNCLIKVKKIRNKLEHEMHGARIVASSSGSTAMFTATYKVGGEEIELCITEVIAFAKDMNVLFSKIQEALMEFANEQYEDHPYYYRLTRYKFSNFNRIFNSELLRVFGKALLPF